MRTLIIFLILLSSNVYAGWFEPMDDNDIRLQYLFTAATIVDWNQTKDFVSRGKLEMNPILGPRPSQQTIDLLIDGAIVSHLFITYALPKKYKKPWIILFLVLELNAINYNSKKSDYRVEFTIPFEYYF